jgi:hypothetical protein
MESTHFAYRIGPKYNMAITQRTSEIQWGLYRTNCRDLIELRYTEECSQIGRCPLSYRDSNRGQENYGNLWIPKNLHTCLGFYICIPKAGATPQSKTQLVGLVLKQFHLPARPVVRE